MHDELDTQVYATLEELYPSLDHVPPSWERVVADASSVRRQRRGRLVVAAVAAMGVAALVLGVLTAPPGREPATASALERAAAALAPAEGSILHTVARSTVTDADGTRTERTETWAQTTPPYDHRQVTYFRDGTRETASANGRPQAYLSSTNTISTLRPGAEVPEPTGIDVGEKRLRDYMLALLRSGEAREAGRAEVDGRDAIRIVAPEQDVTLLVDARTHRPIEWRTVGENPRATVTTRFETYERLPATAENLELLSLAAQHPDAKTDHRISIDP